MKEKRKLPGQDKLMHGTISAIIVFGGMALFGNGIGMGVGVVLASIVGVGKEVYDTKTGGKWSWGDIVADAVGIIAGVSTTMF